MSSQNLAGDRASVPSSLGGEDSEESENSTRDHQKGSSVVRVLGTSVSETLLRPLSRGRCVTGTSTTSRTCCRARASISVFTKKFADSGKRCERASRRKTLRAQSQSRTRVPNNIRARKL